MGRNFGAKEESEEIDPSRGGEGISAGGSCQGLGEGEGIERKVAVE